MRTDGLTGMTKLIGAFRNLANAPKKNLSTVFSLLHVLRLSSVHKCRLHVGYLTIRDTLLRSTHFQSCGSDCTDISTTIRDNNNFTLYKSYLAV